MQHMAEDINDQLIEKMKGVEFGFQLDEATDNNKDAHLICYVQFIDDNNIIEFFLFYKNITAGAKPQDLFEILDTSELYRSSDRRRSAKLVPTLADRGCRVVSATNPPDRNLYFLDLEPLLFH
jgi:hypothetical protein